MGKPDKFEVCLSRPDGVYFPGQVVHGLLMIEVQRPLKVTVTLEDLQLLIWRDQSKGDNVIFNNRTSNKEPLLAQYPGLTGSVKHIVWRTSDQCWEHFNLSLRESRALSVAMETNYRQVQVTELPTFWICQLGLPCVLQTYVNMCLYIFPFDVGDKIWILNGPIPDACLFNRCKH